MHAPMLCFATHVGYICKMFMILTPGVTELGAPTTTAVVSPSAQNTLHNGTALLC
jgi:hypothetical protein